VTGAGFDGVDLDLLADYIGGALTGTPDDERVAALVAEDPVWREAYQRLAPGMATVGTMLRDLPPEPMPGDLAGRLDALFASSPVTPIPVQPTVGESAQPVPAKVLDLEVGRHARAAGARPRRALRWAAPISIAAGVVAFAGFGLSQLSGDSASDSGASSQVNDEAGAPMVAMAPQVGQVLQSGTDYNQATLGQPVDVSSSRIYSGSPGASAEANEYDGSGAAKSPLSRLLGPDALAACLDAIARENGGSPLTVDSVDYALYVGAPALIVRFTAANGGWGWAVGADCGTPGGDADTLQKVPVR
jgi:hypothetical protein